MREVKACLRDFPAVAILGPRQCGKSTLSNMLISGKKESLYLDLESPADLKKLEEPELFFNFHKDKMICLDEIQRVPELFGILRSVIDKRGKNGQFLIVGSASPELIKQSSESLAGRIAYIELTPFLFSEITKDTEKQEGDFNNYWLRGGFPRSYLAGNDNSSLRWRHHFIRTFLERDISQLGFNLPSVTLRRLWTMCAHNHGQLFNASKLGESLGVSHTTIRSYIDLLSQTFMLRVLAPFRANVRKRIVKSPKIYIRDSGILHALLDVETYDDLMGHPVAGPSFEGLLIDNIVGELPGWSAGFYRTSAGAEIDLILTKGERRIAVECKASPAPSLTRGFWSALNDLNIDEAYVIALVKEPYPLKQNVTVAPLPFFIEKMSV